MSNIKYLTALILTAAALASTSGFSVPVSPTAPSTSGTIVSTSESEPKGRWIKNPTNNRWEWKEESEPSAPKNVEWQWVQNTQTGEWTKIRPYVPGTGTTQPVLPVQPLPVQPIPGKPTAVIGGTGEGTGGTGGSLFVMRSSKEGDKIRKIIVRSGRVIDAIGLEYTDMPGQQMVGNRSGGSPHEYYLDVGEYIISVFGTLENGRWLSSLGFKTSKRTIGEVGTKNGQPFEFNANADSSIIGFTGRAGSKIDFIDVIYGPRI